ncbi:MAG: histidinol-phosphatase HisJ family protein [Clostridia bacterium]|nr:histidinol-phosphatase HisJ family protein [Clostridia bacterium]
MATFLTDVHTHSTYSPDGVSPLEEMVKTAQAKGIAFYGVSEHVNYDMLVAEQDGRIYATERHTDVDGYFHAARHLQEDYAGVMNVLVGAELGYTDDVRAQNMYKELIQKHSPDFIVNSIHTLGGIDYWSGDPYYTEGRESVRDKREVYEEYLRLVLRSVKADYDYDIIGHIGYPTRYAPYADRSMPYAEYAKEIDEVLVEIIARGKILEVNSSNDKGVSMTLPDREIMQRYFDLGGRKVSYSSDAHDTARIMDKREKVVAMLKEIGFTYLTVPCKGEHIQVEI